MSILDDILIKHLGLLPDLTTAWCCLSKSPSKRSHCTTTIIRLERFHQSLFSIFFLGLLIPLDWNSSWQFFLRKFKVFNIHGSRQFLLVFRSEFFKQYDSNQVKTAAFFDRNSVAINFCQQKKLVSIEAVIRIMIQIFLRKTKGCRILQKCWVTLW